MHTVELLEEALSLAAKLGYRVRQEWLEGQGGGLCVVRGERWLFVDMAQSLSEQLESVAGVLQEDDVLAEHNVSSELQEYLKPTITEVIVREKRELLANGDIPDYN